jgi:replicative DNA helicase
LESITEQMHGSMALQLIQLQQWQWKPGTPPNIELEVCPYCNKSGGGHFYIEIHGANDQDKKRDGLHICQRCGKSGNLYALRTHLGLTNPEIQGTKAWGNQEAQVDPLPDVEACHQSLLENSDAMEYLIKVRGFSRDIISKMRLGLKPKMYFKNAGEHPGLVFPYLYNGTCVWAHFRTLPDVNDLTAVPKTFSCPRGWDSTLYNGDILKPGLQDLILVEGEMDTICALDNGIPNVCGVPGANMHKADWLQTIDKIGVERIYLLYDKDAVGQKAAQSLATRIGTERCWKIVLPDFVVPGGGTDGGDKPGKDLNEWFRCGGGTLEIFEQLKHDAQQFDVDGVASAAGALDEFLDELEHKGSGHKYRTPWTSLSNIVRFDEGDVIDVLAEEKIGKTTFGINLMEFAVDTYEEDGLIICLEMTRAKLARKWLSHKTGIPDILAKTPEESVALAEQFKQALPVVKQNAANRNGNLYFCYPKFKTAEDIYKLIVACIRRYGIKWVMLDNLQLLCDLTIGTKARTQYLSEISKTLMKIAKDYNIQMVRILQPHRVGTDKMADVSSVDGASQIAKDCDCMLILNRPRINQVTKDDLSQGAYIQTEGVYSPDMLVTVGLSRYSAGGSTTLYIDGATSTVMEQTEGKIAAMKAKSEAATKGAWQTAMASINAVISEPFILP